MRDAGGACWPKVRAGHGWSLDGPDGHSMRGMLHTEGQGSLTNSVVGSWTIDLYQPRAVLLRALFMNTIHLRCAGPSGHTYGPLQQLQWSDSVPPWCIMHNKAQWRTQLAPRGQPGDMLSMPTAICAIPYMWINWGQFLRANLICSAIAFKIRRPWSLALDVTCNWPCLKVIPQKRPTDQWWTCPGDMCRGNGHFSTQQQNGLLVDVHRAVSWRLWPWGNPSDPSWPSDPGDHVRAETWPGEMTPRGCRGGEGLDISHMSSLLHTTLCAKFKMRFPSNTVSGILKIETSLSL